MYDVYCYLLSAMSYESSMSESASKSETAADRKFMMMVSTYGTVRALCTLQVYYLHEYSCTYHYYSTIHVLHVLPEKTGSRYVQFIVGYWLVQGPASQSSESVSESVSVSRSIIKSSIVSYLPVP